MSDRLPQLNQLFGERYRFERQIGKGGMGAVFLAQDLRYHRRVGVKALWQETAGRQAARRFLREIEIAAGLLHPNIVPVLDSGERDGVAFFVMPFAEDGSLRDYLDHRGPLPVPDAVRIAVEVLEALRCAHDHGVVHMDVKPENILLTGGHAMLADFGVSRVTARSSFGKLWSRDEAVGTPLYMCPEHAATRNRHDHRADLYSLGCVLYEMLSGAPPFQGPNTKAVLLKHQTETPFPLTIRSTVSKGLDRVVQHALQKQAADRYQDAASFLRALRLEATPSPTPELVSGPTEVQDTGGEMVKVWIVEDQPGPRAEVKALLDGADGISCEAVFPSGEALMDALKAEWPPDVVVMDIGLPGMSGIEATASLKRSWPGTEVIMLSVHEDYDRVFNAFQAGAISYLDKGASQQEILKAIRLAPRGGCVMTPPIARRVRSMFNQTQDAAWAYRLSPEELSLLSGLTEGQEMEEIAAALGLSRDAVEKRMRLVHAKLHVNHDFSTK